MSTFLGAEDGAMYHCLTCGNRRARDEAIRLLSRTGRTPAQTEALWQVIEAFNEAARLFRRRAVNDNFQPAPTGGGWGSDYSG